MSVARDLAATALGSTCLHFLFSPLSRLHILHALLFWFSLSVSFTLLLAGDGDLMVFNCSVEVAGGSVYAACGEVSPNSN